MLGSKRIEIINNPQEAATKDIESNLIKPDPQAVAIYIESFFELRKL
jgi:hypothetical protein